MHDTVDDQIGTFTVDPPAPVEEPTNEDPADRVERLKRQLADEYARLIEELEVRLAHLDTAISDLTEVRQEKTAELRQYRRDVERLTGERTEKPDRAPAGGSFECPHAGCHRKFATPHGVTMHKARAHKTPAVRDRPLPSTSTKSVYRCGELGAGADGDPCGCEAKSLADLSHHTLTAHRRQPTPAEKILVTPDR